MTRREELLALAERVEALSGPDREVDIILWRLFDRVGQNAPEDRIPLDWLARFTTSLDAAMSLMPEGMHATISTHKPAAAWIGPSQSQAWTYAATPALALTAAALRALAESEQ